MAPWAVIIEAIAALISMAVKTWGQPTEEVKAKLLLVCTVPVPGPTDQILSEIDATLKTISEIK
jgi:hypothetical protein